MHYLGLWAASIAARRRCASASAAVSGAVALRISTARSIFAVARSKLYDHLREMKRDTGVDPSTISVADLGLTPSVVAASRQEEQIVKEGLRRLPLDLQVALELYYFEGLRGPALARVLDIPEGTVRSRLRRGLDLLRERVEELVRSPELRKQTASKLASWAEQINAEWQGRPPDGES